MNLEEVIGDRWEADGTLYGLLPVAKLTTGPAANTEWPWAELHPPSGQPGDRTNDSDAINLVNVQIDVHHGVDNYDDAKEIAEAIKTLFWSMAFALSGSDRVLDIQVGTPQGILSPDGTEWVFVVVLNCRVYLSAGV